ncbi:hypothetical protein IGI04_030045 [Brassica rapa subsp. trilocularis]|uniref:Uncharacterized protein n=1 Tax=Brassica rapa subsp. trilocularis TaxID=1813537 RepID=A0ABQ7LPJ8_BRACM|nr:hypothetical protein IGI04_030045 [Brassica rapa subsp. trilocularis]
MSSKTNRPPKIRPMFFHRGGAAPAILGSRQQRWRFDGSGHAPPILTLIIIVFRKIPTTIFINNPPSCQPPLIFTHLTLSAPSQGRFDVHTQNYRLSDSYDDLGQAFFPNHDSLLGLDKTNPQLPDVLGELTSMKSTMSDSPQGRHSRINVF